jgi:negative regulator of sigma E activity
MTGILAAGCLLLGTGRALAGEMEDPLAVLHRLAQSAGRTGYRGDKVLIDFSQGVPRITRYQVTHAMPGMERRDYREDGRTVISRDGWLWQYHPDRQSVVRTRGTPPEEWDVLQRENLKLVLQNYQVNLQEGKPILGRRNLQVSFSPHQPGSRPSRKVWIDVEKGVPLRGEVYGVDGTLYHETHFEDLRYENPRGKEIFDIHAVGRPVVHEEVDQGECIPIGQGQNTRWRDVAWPAAPPSGFAGKCLRLKESPAGREAQVLYSDGLSALSFFQEQGEKNLPREQRRAREVKIGARPALLYDLGLMRLLKWNSRGRHFVMVGEVSGEELTRAAGSILDEDQSRRRRER